MWRGQRWRGSTLLLREDAEVCSCLSCACFFLSFIFLSYLGINGTDLFQAVRFDLFGSAQGHNRALPPLSERRCRETYRIDVVLEDFFWMADLQIFMELHRRLIPLLHLRDGCGLLDLFDDFSSITNNVRPSQGGVAAAARRSTRSISWKRRASQEFRCNFLFLLWCFILFDISLNTRVLFTQKNKIVSLLRSIWIGGIPNGQNHLVYVASLHFIYPNYI
jgi:hypothetical protein